jgi:hypothetical protein
VHGGVSGNGEIVVSTLTLVTPPPAASVLVWRKMLV